VHQRSALASARADATDRRITTTPTIANRQQNFDVEFTDVPEVGIPAFKGGPPSRVIKIIKLAENITQIIEPQ